MKGREKTSTAPEFVVDASNPNRIRVWARADVFENVGAVMDADERRAGAELAIERLAAQLRKSRAA